MKSSLENTSALERKLNIEVPAAEVQVAFDRALKGVQRTVQVKGFRKGKAPLTTIRSIYGDRLKQDVIQELVQSNYSAAIQQHSLDPVSFPTIEFDPMEDEKDFAFTAEFEVRPEVKSPVIEGLVVQREKMELNDETVASTLEEIRKNRAETVPVLEDRGAQMGDTAIVDFKGWIDGKELENGAGTDHSLELGSNSFIPGFEEGVVGMKTGQSKDVNISFPTEYHAAELAGKPVKFEVTLKELKNKSLPEINDEFAKGLGPYESLDALKTAIREDFTKREEKRIADEFKNRLMRVLVEKNPVDVPKALMTEQKKALVDDFKKRMEQQGLPEDQFDAYKEKWDADFEKTASYMIQSSFLIDKIAAEQNLRASNSDLEHKLDEYAAESGIEMKRLKEFYADQDRKARLSYQVTEEKVLNYLTGKAKIEDVPKSEIPAETQA